MTIARELRLELDELCERLEMPRELLVTIVEQGIIEPVEVRDGCWVFDGSVTVRLSRAVRLHRDLEIDWSGVALALELLEEMEALREENRMLRRRLRRFIE